MCFSPNSKRVLTVVVPVLLVVSLWAGCGDDDSNASGPTQSSLTSSAVTASECKIFENFQAADGFLSSQDCLLYSYDGEGTLQIDRINAAFNCCPDSFTVEVTLEGSLITIVEKEILANGGCDCLCLFDLNYSIEGVKPGQYTIRVIEPYKSHVEEDPLLQFSVDLVATPSGSFCVDRTGYPWSINHTPVGVVTASSGCKGDFPENAAGLLPSLNCLQYAYDGVGILTMDHINAVFNCCADSFSVDISMVMDTIVIEEAEHYVASGPCHCVCPFDLSYDINDLAPGEYTVRVVGPYSDQYGGILVFDIDLLTTPSGEYCVEGQF